MGGKSRLGALFAPVFSIPQFDKNQPELWESYFSFVQALVQSIRGDTIHIFNKIVKVI